MKARIPLPTIALVCLVCLVSLVVSPSRTAAAPAADEPVAQTYGAGVELEHSTAIAEILAAPEAWDGKRVRIEGEVAEVCPKAGCWMTLREGGQELRVKVEDGVIVFPAAARGGRAVAEGVIEVRSLSRDDYAAWQAHLAEEKGEAFDPASVGEGPHLYVQLRGTGAEISAPVATSGGGDVGDGEGR